MKLPKFSQLFNCERAENKTMQPRLVERGQNKCSFLEFLANSLTYLHLIE